MHVTVRYLGSVLYQWRASQNKSRAQWAMILQAGGLRETEPTIVHFLEQAEQLDLWTLDYNIDKLDEFLDAMMTEIYRHPDDQDRWKSLNSLLAPHYMNLLSLRP